MSDVPPIKIMKPGTFTSVEGVKVSFSLADLEAAAAAYDPASDPAPMVIGHPKIDAPAYGWAKQLRVEDGHLVADPDPARTHPEFAEAVRGGRYAKVSGKFYLPADPHNPKPGSLYLRHIGFLGAAAPAVKGLGTVHFSEEAAGEGVTIETNVKEQFVTKENQEASFAEREAAISKREKAIAARETEIAAKEGDVAAREAAARQIRHESNVSFAEGLIAAGRLAPAGRDLAVGVLDQLEAAKAVSFGEANGKLTPASAFRKLLEGAQPLVSFSEHSKAEDETAAGVSFAAPAGCKPDPASLKIHQKAVELQGADPKLSYLEAVKRAGG